MKDLYRDAAIVLQIMRQINSRHAARAKLTLDEVARCERIPGMGRNRGGGHP